MLEILYAMVLQGYIGLDRGYTGVYTGSMLGMLYIFGGLGFLIFM